MPLLHYDKAQTKNKTKSYISNISQGNVVNFFGDFFGGLVGCISQSLTAHGFQQTLWGFQRHQVVALKLSPAERNEEGNVLNIMQLA